SDFGVAGGNRGAACSGPDSRGRGLTGTSPARGRTDTGCGLSRQEQATGLAVGTGSWTGFCPPQAVLLPLPGARLSWHGNLFSSKHRARSRKARELAFVAFAKRLFTKGAFRYSGGALLARARSIGSFLENPTVFRTASHGNASFTYHP